MKLFATRLTVVWCVLFGFYLSPGEETVEDVDHLGKGEISFETLAQIQGLLQAAVPKVEKSVVYIELKNGSGSGVLVDEHGLIYTAAHVVLDEGGKFQDVSVMLDDGRKFGVELVAKDQDNDAAIVRIKGNIATPDYCRLAEKASMPGDWVFSMGHGDGYHEDRGAPVRLGRVISNRLGVYKTDCKLIGGDSGGPLFNLKGELIGIHSWVGMNLEVNAHVPLLFFHQMMQTEEGGDQ